MNNLDALVHADFSPGVDAVAAKARELSGGREVFFFKDFNASSYYYLDGANVLVTDTPSSYERHHSSPAIRAGGQLRLLPPQEMMALIARRDTVCATTIVSHARLQAYLARLPPELADTLQHLSVRGYHLHYFVSAGAPPG